MTPRPGAAQELRALARLHGVQLSYKSKLTGARQAAPPETLLAVLRALGAPVEHARDVPHALRARRHALDERVAEPVVVAWNGSSAPLELRPPPRESGARVACALTLEEGETSRWSVDLSEAPSRVTLGLDGLPRRVCRLDLPPVPIGAHCLAFELSGRRHEVTILAAPVGAGRPSPEQMTPGWGTFLPLHALRTGRSLGIGDLTDLEALARGTAELGSRTVATLPLLAQFLDEPCEPSPYLPVSRRFWNEIFLDFTRLPEFARCEEARRLASSAPFRRVRRALTAEPLVDYRRVMALRRRVLETLARFVAGCNELGGALRAYADAEPRAVDYARFRAVQERERRGFRSWPAGLRDGAIGPGDHDEDALRYHLYVQWRTDEQLGEVARVMARSGEGLYLDFPLGVHPDGYDLWRERERFAEGISAGAPPDGYSARGQDWGFPPLHPDRIRAGGHRYFASCLGHHLRHAGILRLDHVMSLHRLFWVPRGMDAKRGVYVRYPAEELYATLCIESHKRKAIVVGEDIGTVPPEVRPMMARHGLLRTYVLQRELLVGPGDATARVPRSSVAVTSTHDHHPFASFWKAGDVDDRLALGMIGPAAAKRERAARLHAQRGLIGSLSRGGWLRPGVVDLPSVFAAALACLGESEARLVIVNLEDLWGETRPQNTPATTKERPNWKRKARLPLESFLVSRRVSAALRALDRARRKEEAR